MLGKRGFLACLVRSGVLLSLIVVVSGRTVQAQTFSNPKNISNSAGFSVSPKVALDGDGNINAVWIENNDIFFSRSSDVGSTFSVPKNISANSDRSGFAQLAVDGSSGNIYVVWQELDLAAFKIDVFFSGSTDGGDSFSTPMDISPGSGSAGKPRIAVDGSGNINVVWIERTFPGFDVFFSRSIDAGMSFSLPINVSVSGAASFSAEPRLAVDGIGTIYVIWTDFPVADADIIFSHSTDGGGTFSVPKNISATAGNAARPRLAVDDSGNINVVWEDLTPGNREILFSRFTATGAFVPPINISNTPGLSVLPVVALDTSGNVNVIWGESEILNFALQPADIFYTRSTDGTTFSSPTNISNNSGDSSAEVFRGGDRLAVDGDGNINVVWDDFTLGNQDVLFSRSTDGGMTFSSAIPISDNMTDSSGARLALNGSGDVYVVWTECTGTASECEESIPGPPESVDIFFSRSLNAVTDALNEAGVDVSTVPTEVVDALTAADQGSVLTVVEAGTTADQNISLEPDGAVVLGEGSTFTGNIEGGANNTVVLGDNTTVAGNITGVGLLFVGGSNVQINGNVGDDQSNEVLVGQGAQVTFSGNLAAATLVIGEDGVVTIDGNLDLATSLVMGANASLMVSGNVICDSGATAMIDPTAIANITVVGNVDDCDALLALLP